MDLVVKYEFRFGVWIWSWKMKTDLDLRYPEVWQLVWNGRNERKTLCIKLLDSLHFTAAA